MYHPPHLSKDQDIALAAGECVHISTPGGGGYGDAYARDPEQVLLDVRRGYYAPEEAESLFTVALTKDPLGLNAETTATRRRKKVTE